MSTLRYPVVELRQYTLRPGQRDVLIDLFDREFVESQEATGMAIVGQFRDLDDPDRDRDRLQRSRGKLDDDFQPPHVPADGRGLRQPEPNPALGRGRARHGRRPARPAALTRQRP